MFQAPFFKSDPIPAYHRKKRSPLLIERDLNIPNSIKSKHSFETESVESDMKENNINIANSPIKIRSHLSQFLHAERLVSSCYVPQNTQTERSQCIPNKYLVLEGKIQVSKANSTGMLCKWRFSRMPYPKQLPKVSVDYVQELVSINIPHVVPLHQLSALNKSPVNYTVQLQSFSDRGQKQQLYLTISIRYRQHSDYFAPEMRCWLSDSVPEIINHKLSTRALYQEYLPKFSKKVLDQLLTAILLEASVLVYSSDHIALASFMFLLTHFAKGIELVHTHCYYLWDKELLDLPVPFIFGTLSKQLFMSGMSSKGIHTSPSECRPPILVDLESNKVYHIQPLKTRKRQQSLSQSGFGLEKCGELISRLVKIANLYSSSKTKQYVDSLEEEQSRVFASSFVNTMHFKNIFPK